MSETLVRLEPAQKIISEKLRKAGVYKTQSEVIRAGIVELGIKHRIFRNFKELEDELAFRKAKQISDEIDAGKRKVFTKEQVMKKYGFK